MKIVIHGTNGGYKIITPDKDVAGLFDARPDYNKVAAIGQQAYSIHFSGDNVIFSKYKIIRDGIGDLRTGNVAFSVIIPYTKKIAGEFVKEMLDKLADTFIGKHIENNNLGIIRGEDWNFVTEIENQYQLKLSSKAGYIPNSNIRRGPREAAFAYYSDDKDLLKYLNAPYQDEYSQYKQIFLIDAKLKDEDKNPLNALLHSDGDLTGKIDFNPPKPPPPPPPPPAPDTSRETNEARDELKKKNEQPLPISDGTPGAEPISGLPEPTKKSIVFGGPTNDDDNDDEEEEEEEYNKEPLYERLLNWIQANRTTVIVIAAALMLMPLSVVLTYLFVIPKIHPPADDFREERGVMPGSIVADIDDDMLLSPDRMIDSVKANKAASSAAAAPPAEGPATVAGTTGRTSAQASTPAAKQSAGTAGALSPKDSEIVKYLKSGDVTKAELEKHKAENPDLNPDLRKSIDLALDFWKKYSKEGDIQPYRDYQAKIKKDVYLKSSALSGLVDDICNLKIDKRLNSLTTSDLNQSITKIGESLKQ